MVDKQLVHAIVAAGVEDPAAAEDMVARVTAAVIDRIRLGKTVRLDGIGRLGSRSKLKDTYCQGAGRVEVTVVVLKHPDELSRGEPLPLSKARR